MAVTRSSQRRGGTPLAEHQNQSSRRSSGAAPRGASRDLACLDALGDGLLLAHPRASVGRLAKPLAAQPPALPLLLASEARLIRARHAAPSGAARAAAHSRPPQLARSVSSPQPTAIGCRRSRLPVRARTQHSTRPPCLRAPLTCPSAGANRRSRSTPACRNGPLEYSSERTIEQSQQPTGSNSEGVA